jgi:predicted nuclease of predicted toxin-antitoxin system
VNLLFDQNISHRVLPGVKNVFPQAKHVRDFELQFATDRQIWTFAKENDFAIVTFDADFSELATLYGHPPKIIWLRFGNTLTHNLIEKIAQKADIIFEFLTSDTYIDVATLEVEDF